MTFPLPRHFTLHLRLRHHLEAPSQNLFYSPHLSTSPSLMLPSFDCLHPSEQLLYASRNSTSPSPSFVETITRFTPNVVRELHKDASFEQFPHYVEAWQLV